MSADNHVNGVKGDPDCHHDESFNTTSIKQSLLSPAYLHTNSTSHVWAFSAVAELIDNAYDPDVNATQLKIDIVDVEGLKCLTFLDNGAGMSPHTLYKMLSFGFCDKDKYAVTRHKPVGHYGNGFKSGSMRLGKDALVLSRHGHGKDSIASVGLLSQTYLSAIKSETILVPTVSWSFVTQERIDSPDADASLQSITRFSILKNEAAILSTIGSKIKKTGTYIMIYNLRKMSNGELEFDFEKDVTDISIVEDETSTDNMLYARQDRINTNPTTYYSLRAYCAILFLRPKMQIFVRNVKVKTKLIKKSLSKTLVDTYRPHGVDKPQKIVFGFTGESDNYGIMMYYRNRLIRSYVRVGYQLKPNSMGAGVIGIIECNYLTPTHNKQDFDYNKHYRSTMFALGQKLNDYWNEKCGDQEMPPQTVSELVPDQLWVQCENPDCLKWRKVPGDVTAEELPDKWYCKDNTDPNFASCDAPIEQEEMDQDSEPYVKTFKRNKQRAAESQRVANLIMERQKQAQIMEQAQRNQNKGGHIFTVGSMQRTPGTLQNGANGTATTDNDDDEIRILPSSPANRTFNSNQPITSQVVSQNAAAMQRKVNSMNDDDDLVVTAVTQARTPLSKRPAPQTPVNLSNKKNKTASAHLFIVDGPNTIKEMGLTSPEDQQIVTKLVKLHPKTRWNLLVSRTLQLRNLRSQVCALLQMLVPELDQNAVGVKTEPVDGTKLVSLLNQVLEANQSGDDAATSSHQPSTSQRGVSAGSAPVKTEIFAPASNANVSSL
ncbi:hypothetical protein ACHWQZ_G005748 [Mnemiopsis leidyi]